MSLIEKAAKHLESLNQRQEIAEPGTAEVDQVTSGQITLTVSALQPAASRSVQIDRNRLLASGMIVPDTPTSLIAEEFRVLKQPLLANASPHGRSRPIRNANLIMVTSALPQEGKSFVAVNLAMSIAMELERTALLVDADVARPSLPGLLGLEPQTGLLDVLQDKSMQIGDVMLRTDVEKLNLVMAGTSHSRATELLASEAMASLVDEIANRYPDRIVIFDSPPLLMTTQARALARHMGQIVFVVHAEQTLQSAVKEALSTISACPVKYMVLNQMRSVNQLVYGYDYRYGSRH